MSRRRKLAIVVGTNLQARIAREIIPACSSIPAFDGIEVVSLADLYQLHADLSDFGRLLCLRTMSRKPWYDRNRLEKAIAIPQLIPQLLRLSRRFLAFIFFVDTGVLERSCIQVLRRMGRRTIVLQDAMKRRPKDGNKRALEWFGGGGADAYLLTGERYRDMVRTNSVRIVGSPIHNCEIRDLPPGDRLLVVGACFARYGEMTLRDEVLFFESVVETVASFGTVELRLHPHNDSAAYGRLNRDGVLVTQGTPLDESLRQARIVIGLNSSVLLEALSAQRAVATIDWLPSSYEQPIRQGVNPCSSLADLEGFLRAASEGGVGFPDTTTIESELKAHIACTGGESIARIVEALTELGA